MKRLLIRKPAFWTIIIIPILILTGCGSRSTYQPHQPVKTEPRTTPSPRPTPKPPERLSAEELTIPCRIKNRIGKEPGSQSKWYKIELDRSTTIDVTLENLYGERGIELKLLNKNGISIARGERRGSVVRISRSLTRGLYYLQLRAREPGSTDNFYQLTIKSLTGRGSSMDNPVYLQPGSTFIDAVGRKSGTISRWYRVNLKTPSKLNVNLSADKRYRDFDLKLRNSTGKILTSGTATGPTEQISQKLCEGDYRIEVLSAGDDAGGNYALTVKAYPLNLNNPGATIENAIVVTSEENPITGYLGEMLGLKSRWYKIDANKKVCLEVQFKVIKNLSKLRIELIEIKNDEKNSLQLIRYSKKSNTHIKHIEKGTYYLRVKTDQKRGASEYRLSVYLREGHENIEFTKIDH
jgi:hypothetical protein